MSLLKRKRFWTEVSVQEGEGGAMVLLDGRPLKTPARRALVLPSRAYAEAVAEEWASIEGEIDASRLHMTRAANVSIDRIADDPAPVVGVIAEYGGSDLLCYRAQAPQELVARQRAAWDPLLDWAEDAFGVRLAVTEGIVHVPQDPEGQAVLRGRVAEFNAFQLAGLHDLVTISGSLILGLATALGRHDADKAFELSRIDEQWQEDQWGVDDEAQALTDARREGFRRAARIMEMSNPAGL